MTDAANTFGIYGKLPAHGDFISRNLPSAFLAHLDDWLQGFIASSQEQLTDDWLDIYLTSPIWRFVVSKGCIDGHAWAGIMIPSVDSVGRYFPFCIVNKLENDCNLVDTISTQAPWFEELEELAMEALQEEFNADTVLDKLQDIRAESQPFFYEKNNSPQHADPGYGANPDNIAMIMDFEEQLPSSTNAALLDWLLAKQFPSYSLWHSKGSDLVSPSFLVSQGLPKLGGSAAMLQGDWQHWSWTVPFQLAADAVDEEELVF